VQETISTLKFGQRAKNIKNKPKVNRQYTVEELLKILVHKEEELILLHCRNKNLEALLQLHNITYDKDDLRSPFDTHVEEKDPMIQFGQIGRKEAIDKATQAEDIAECKVQPLAKMINQATSPDLADSKRTLAEESSSRKDEEFKMKIYKENIELKAYIDRITSELTEALEREKVLQEDIRKKDLQITQLEESSIEPESDSSKLFMKFERWSDSKVCLEMELTEACRLYLEQKKVELTQEPLLSEVRGDESTGDSILQVPANFEIEAEDDTTTKETEMVDSLKLLAKEYPELETEVTSYLKGISKPQLEKMHYSVQNTDGLGKHLIVKLIDSLLRMRRLLKGVPSAMNQVTAKLETIVTAPASPTTHNSSPFLDKIKQLEQQMESTQKEVGEYMKNCQMLKEMIQKQPESVNHETVGKISEFSLKPMQRKLTSDHFLSGNEINPSAFYKPSESSFSLSGSVQSNGVDHSPKNHLISNRSVIHSYLSRNPRILKHIKGGLRKEPLLIQDVEERQEWSLLSLLKKCCFVPEDRHVG
jgi:hypothetical protein